MDSQGRLHMPGFVGETFDETGVLKESEGADREQTNRKQRRAREATDRRIAKLTNRERV
jgi:hypothetical protein